MLAAHRDRPGIQRIEPDVEVGRRVGDPLVGPVRIGSRDTVPTVVADKIVREQLSHRVEPPIHEMVDDLREQPGRDVLRLRGPRVGGHLGAELIETGERGALGGSVTSVELGQRGDEVVVVEVDLAGDPAGVVQLVDDEHLHRERGGLTAVQPDQREPLAPHGHRLGVDHTEHLVDARGVHTEALAVVQRRRRDRPAPVEAHDIVGRHIHGA